MNIAAWQQAKKIAKHVELFYGSNPTRKIF
jgi:hypothetical protein